MLSLYLLNRALRHQQRVPSFGGAHADADELARQHGMIGIPERRLDFQRARLRVDAVQRVLDVPLIGGHGPVVEDELDRKGSACGVLKERHLRFADLEAHPHGIERHDRGQRLRRCFGHQAADLQQAVADTSADRRADRRVLEIQLCGPQDRASGVHGRFARGHRRLAGLAGGERVVEILPRRRLLPDERIEAFDVLSSLQKRGLGLCDIRRGLRQRAARALDFRLVRTHVEDVQHLPRTHVRSDVEGAPIGRPRAPSSR